MRSLSIRYKLALILSLLIGAVSLFIFLYFPAALEREALDATTAKARSIAEMTAFSVSPGLYFEDAQAMEEAFRGARQNRDLAYLVLLNGSGRLSASHNQIRADRVDYIRSRTKSRITEDGSLYQLMTPVLYKGTPIGELFLGLSLSEVRSRAAASRTTVGLVSLAVFLIGIGAAFGISTVLTGPMKQMVATVSRISEGDLTQRAPVGSRDEVGRLAVSFNAMVAKLEQQMSSIQLLNQIARAVAERLDLESIFQVVIHHLETRLPVDYGCICSYDPGADALTVLAVGSASRDVATRVGYGRGSPIPLEPTGLRPALSGEGVEAPDTSIAEAGAWRDLAREGLGSGAAIPLKVEGRVFGLMILARRSKSAYRPEDMTFLRALSEHVSLAACQARLHEDLKDAYEQLRKTQQEAMQQERLRALGQMASGIVHDVNNALSPVTGFVELLLLTEHDLSERARRYLATIQTSATDIAHIVARMREFYRQRIKQDVSLPLSLNTLVQQVVDLTRPRWRDIPMERGIVIETRLDLRPELPQMLGIESEIREALTNLVFNAVDAMPKGGTLSIRTSTVGDGGAGPPEAFTLEVTDTGAGMDEETRRRCLEPFFSTKGERGTGLGLAMVFGVMQRHEGEVEIESQPGSGTTVRLRFPTDTRPEEPVPTPVEAAPLNATLRILVIDDEPLVRDLVRDMLRVDGHQVELADDGGAGLKAFREALGTERPFDVVMTDLGMPYVDGREVARTVKRESPRTPVVLLTGWGTRLHAEGDIPEEIDVILNKPPRMAPLRQALEKVHAAREPGPGRREAG